MEMINMTIDGIKTQVPRNYTVLEAARTLNINIPTLCYLKGLNEVGACRICVVEVQGARALQASCVQPVAEGMVVRSSSPSVVRDQNKCILCGRCVSV